MENTLLKNIDIKNIGTDKNSTKASAYSVIGFDMDHTICCYKLKQLLTLLQDANCADLVDNASYPQALLITDEEQSKILSFGTRSSLDLEAGNVQKQGKEGVVLKAYHGLKELDDCEIVELYGEDRVFKRLDQSTLSGENIRCMNEFYGINVAAVFTKIIMLKDSKNYRVLNQKTYIDINQDIQQCINRCYCHWTEDVVYHMKDCGKFFPKLYESPETYVYQVEQEFIDCIKNLRAQGKYVFLNTNSHWYMAETVLDNIFKNEDWRELFDQVIIFGMKPHFWRSDIEKPFYKLDLNIPSQRGKFNGNFDDKDNKLLISGSMQDLGAYFKQKFGENYRGIYFGDSPLSDVLNCQKFGEGHWDGAFIFEELRELDLNKKELLEHFPNYQEVWGSALSQKDPRNPDNQIDTIYLDIAKNGAFKTFSSVFSEECYDFLKN